MRFVPRGADPPPEALAKADQAGDTELVRARRHIGDPVLSKKAFEFATYKAPEVKLRLDALFHGKCAYCENFYASSAPVDVEHYRPKGAVEGEADHPGYWWIAMSWDNLLPSCIDCNRRRRQIVPAGGSASLLALNETSREFSAAVEMLTGKKDCFPILGSRAVPEASDFGAEQPCLLNPCIDQPEEHLGFYVDRGHVIGLVVPKPVAGAEGGAHLPLAGQGVTPQAVAGHAAAAGLSVRGAVSIQVYGLNRLSLVQERTRLLRRLEFLEGLALELAELADRLDPPEGGPPSPLRDREIAGRLRFLQDRILEEMVGMAAPDAPHSVMAGEWIRGFRARIGAPPG